MEESEINELGVRELEHKCEDLVPTSLLDSEALEVEEHAASLHATEDAGIDLSHAGCEIDPEKPKRTRKRKVYGLSAVRRSARIKLKQKFHDDP